MSNTYTQIYIHIVFAVKGRQNLIPKEHKTELHGYIMGIISNKKQTVIQINSMPDHIHILVGITPDTPISDLVRDIKANSSKFINQKRWVMGRFEWQVGFGAFSYSRSHLDALVKYIKNQEKHHIRKTFREEYLEILKRFNVDYDERYIFDWVEAGP
ncbi:IS200/IS605 family transposase [Candidatus Poribacteria bacterium]|nr:IS200/IS605 family transposase [Candidatus Poribacteria bacterium]